MPRKPKLISPWFIGQRVRVHGTVSFHYDVPYRPENDDPWKCRTGDKKIYEKHPCEPFEGFVVGKSTRQTGTYQAAFYGGGYDGEAEPEQAYLSNPITHTVLYVRRNLRSCQLMCLPEQLDFLDQPHAT